MRQLESELMNERCKKEELVKETDLNRERLDKLSRNCDEL